MKTKLRDEISLSDKENGYSLSEIDCELIFYPVLGTVPPIALGTWSMALVLWQPPEYYLFIRCSCFCGGY